MVFVEDDEIPVNLVHPLVLFLDGAVLKTEEILERPKAHNGLPLVRLLILFVYRRIARTLAASDELPPLEVDVRHQVLAPRRRNRGLEGENQHALRAHPLRELVRGECLAEAHLRVPEEFRRLPLPVLLRGFVVCERVLYRPLLLLAQLEVLRPLLDVLNPRLNAENRGLHVAERAPVPLVAVFAFVELCEAVLQQDRAHVMVSEHSAVVAQGRPRAENPELDGDSVRLLPDAFSRAARRLADLDVAPVRLDAHKLVGVDYRLDVRLVGE